MPDAIRGGRANASRILRQLTSAFSFASNLPQRGRASFRVFRALSFAGAQVIANPCSGGSNPEAAPRGERIARRVPDQVLLACAFDADRGSGAKDIFQ